MKNPFILINTFTVAPEDQERIVALLTKATEETVKNVDGFISSTVHRSLDGTRVTTYAQWESKDAYENMRRNATVSPYLDEALTFGKFEMGMYEIVETFVKSPK